MPTDRQKLYFYIDETGQDTRGSLYIVAIAVIKAVERENLERSLTEIESASEKGLKKWFKTSPKRRDAYLQRVLQVVRLIQPVYYRIYESGTDYIPRVAETVLAAIRHMNPPVRSSLTIVVDGLKPAEQQLVSRLIRLPTLPYTRTVRGERDESTPFLRLADSLVGFVRHAHLNEEYAKPIWPKLRPYFERI